jgi:hypothetical protein
METEMKPQAKKEWQTPELIVLVRSKPEEAVLTACKNTHTTAGISGQYEGCGSSTCGPCETPTTS